MLTVFFEDGCFHEVARSYARPPRVVRLGTLALLALAFLYAISVPVSAQPYCAYVTNQGSDTVSVIDIATETVAATVSVGHIPFGVAVTPDGATVYVANDSTPAKAVSVIATQSNTVTATITLDGIPFGVAVAPDGRSAYVTAGSVFVIDTTTNAFAAPTITAGKGPGLPAVSPDSRFVYVPNTQSLSFRTTAPGDVSVIDTTSNRVVATVAVGNNPISAAITPDGTFAYVANLQALGSGTATRGDLSIIDTAKAVTDPLHAVAGTISVDDNPGGVAISPDGNRAYVTNTGSNTVSVLDTAKAITDPLHAVVKTIPAGNLPFGVAFTPDGTMVYVANLQSLGDVPVPGDVSVIDTTTNAVVATVNVGNNPIAIAVASVPGGCTGVSHICVGDCDGGGTVTVNEIIILVNMALGIQTELSACVGGIPPNITDTSQIDVALIIRAVNSALNGCGV